MKAREKVLLIYAVSFLANCPAVLRDILSSVEITLDLVLIIFLLGAAAGLFYGTIITIIALCLRIFTVKQLKENL